MIASMAEMVVNGVATLKVSNIMETLCGTTFSKSSVSEVCKDLDEKVKEFRERPLTGNYPFLTVDATYFKVRVNHRIVSRAFMITYGTNQEGLREIIGFGVYDNESKPTWNAFLQSLKERGLKGLLMITSDAREGIRDAIISDYMDVAESAMTCLDEGFESAMTVMTLPKHLRKYFRTSNHIERLNKELKCRSSVIGIFPNEDSLLRLMGSVLLERNDAAAARKALFSPATYTALLNSKTVTDLGRLAEEQHKLKGCLRSTFSGAVR